MTYDAEELRRLECVKDRLHRLGDAVTALVLFLEMGDLGRAQLEAKRLNERARALSDAVRCLQSSRP